MHSDIKFITSSSQPSLQQDNQLNVTVGLRGMEDRAGLIISVLEKKD